MRDALLHLYEPAYLETHPLVQLASASSAARSHPGSRLFQTLLNAIEALRPAPGLPAAARAARGYRLLELRYIEGLSASEVIEQLAISKSQYQRDHARALAAVASLLKTDWWRWSAPSDAGSRESLALDEAAYLAVNRRTDLVDLSELMSELVVLLQPIAIENASSIILHQSDTPIKLMGDRVVFRQIFMGLLDTGLERGRGGLLTVEVQDQRSVVDVTIRAVTTLEEAFSDSANHHTEAEVIRRLVEALDGQLLIDRSGPSQEWRSRVRLRLSHRPSALIVDNQRDFIGLISRYLEAESWDAISVESGLEACSLARERRPDLILLDVMMPGQDGWELLRELKALSETQAIPVVVCSVLYEPRVAKALGADAYLAKPVTPASLAQVLAPYQYRKDTHEPEPSP